MSDHFWIAVTGAVGAAALIFYIYQAILMRGTLQVTQDASLEAVRARLDVVAPAVTLDAREPEWEPYAAPGYGGLPVGKWPQGRLFEFPEKQGERIVLQQIFQITNEGGHRVEARFEGDLFLHEQVEENRAELRKVDTLLLAPDSTNRSRTIYLQKAFTIGELADNYRAREAGQALPHRVTGTVTVHDDRDNGVTDTWSLELTGCPVQPHSTRDSVWLVVPFDVQEGSGLRSLTYTLLPNRERIHWISRKADRRLPQPKL